VKKGVTLKALFAALTIYFPVVAEAGPFGIDAGSNVSIYSGRPSSVKGAFKIVVPKPHDEFESYTAISTTETGICKVWGVGRNHSDDRYGSSVRDTYQRLKETLEAKYGQGRQFDYLKAGALWKNSNEWVMAIRQNERTLVTYWTVENMGAPLPDGIVAITLEVKALSSDTAYLDLTYEFSNFKRCRAVFAAASADAL
jgi:hypothetical protein